MRLSLRLLTIAVLVVSTSTAQAQRPHYAFFVIGPDSGAVRSQTSEWMATELRSEGSTDSLFASDIHRVPSRRVGADGN